MPQIYTKTADGRDAELMVVAPTTPNKIILPAGATTTLGTTGAAGDFLHRIIYTVTNAASGGKVEVLDNAVSTGISTLNVTPIADHNMEINLISEAGALTVTMGVNVNGVAIGDFT